MKTLSQKALKEALHYCPDTGVFTHLTDTFNRKAGEQAGVISTHGYRQVYVYGKPFYAHRLAFLYMLGAFPAELVDHINGVRSDNSWNNLRAATFSQNNVHKPLRKDNKTGYTGVLKENKKFRAGVTINKKYVNLGLFETAEEAGRVAQAARHKYFGEFAVSAQKQ